MTINYVWQFHQFDVAPVADGLANVVMVIHWRLHGSEGGHSTSVYGTVGLPDANPDNFIALEDITEQWAIEATSALISVAEQKAVLAANLDALKHPRTVGVVPPFAAV